MPTLANMNLCVGCTACVSKCPKHCLNMVYDDVGFAYPKLTNTEQCKKCNLCERACPILNKIEIEDENTRAFAAFSLDNQIRLESSSGGIFTELALQVLAKNGVVYGAAYNDKWMVEHIAVDSIEKLHKLRGAKYAESRLEGVFTEIERHLNNKREVLFSATPCQVAGLKAFLKCDYSSLLCVDFVCHGIPSPLVWEKYIYERKRADGEMEMPCLINQRSKHTGWSRYSYSSVIEYPDGRKYSAVSSEDLFMKLFCNDYISRKSCHSCAFKGYDRISDITLGDFWGIWDIAPEMDDGKGTSLVLIHSEKGRKAFSNLGNRIKYRDTTLEEASKENLALLCAALEKKERENVLGEIKNGNLSKLYDLFPSDMPTEVLLGKKFVQKLMKAIFQKN